MSCPKLYLAIVPLQRTTQSETDLPAVENIEKPQWNIKTELRDDVASSRTPMIIESSNEQNLNDHSSQTAKKFIELCYTCLDKHTELYRMDSELMKAYSAVIGEQVLEADEAMRVCGTCSAVLLKYCTFRERCLQARELLQDALRGNSVPNLFYDVKGICHNLDIKDTETTITDCLTDSISNQETAKNKTDNSHDNDRNDLYEMKLYCDDDKDDDNFVSLCTKISEENDNLISAIGNQKFQYVSTVESQNSTYSNFDAEEIVLLKDSVAAFTKSKTVIDEIEDLQSRATDLDSNLKENNENNKNEIIKRRLRDKQLHCADKVSIAAFESDYNCKITCLSKEEQIKELEARKESRNYLNSTFKCDRCYKGFRNVRSYKNHMIVHDPVSGDMVCDICQMRMKRNCDMNHHKLNHKMKFTCRECDSVFSFAFQAKSHFKWHKGTKYECRYCLVKFRKPTSYFSHVRLKHASKHLACDLCGETFIGQRGLALHKQKAHKDLPASIKSVLKCGTCDVQFANEEALSRHAATSGGECDRNLKWCIKCGEGFANKRLLSKHKDTHLLYHSTIELDSGDKECPDQKSNHRLVVSSKKNVVCEMCGQLTASVAQLKIHQRKHTGEKPFRCNQCPKSFGQNCALKVHMRMHTGETPYQCPQCPKAFVNTSNLMRHKTVHTGEKLFQCDICGKWFGHKGSVQLHIRTVHMRLPAPPRRKRTRIKRNKTISTKV